MKNRQYNEQTIAHWTLPVGQIGNMYGGTSQRGGPWHIYGTLSVWERVLMAGRNPSSGVDEVIIYETGQYRLMETGDITNTMADGNDRGEHGFENHGQLYSAVGSKMNFSSPYSKIKNYGTGYTELNGVLDLNGYIDNKSQFVMNGAMTVQNEGRVINAGSFTNNSTVNNYGNWSDSGVLTNNGTFNHNNGVFNHRIAGDGYFNYNGGQLSIQSLTGKGTLKISNGLSSSIESLSGWSVINYGTLAIGGGSFNKVTNHNNAVLNVSNPTFAGTLNNTGTANLNGLWTFSNGNLQSAGTVTTNRWDNVFHSLGTTGDQELKYVGLNSSVPQEVKTSLNAFFQKYVPGSVAKTLAQHASFSGGKVIISGVNITETQRDDLAKAFKSQLFILSNRVSSSSLVQCA